jgi:hypothetical protein
MVGVSCSSSVELNDNSEGRQTRYAGSEGVGMRNDFCCEADLGLMKGILVL